MKQRIQSSPSYLIESDNFMNGKKKGGNKTYKLKVNSLIVLQLGQSAILIIFYMSKVNYDTQI
jgi:hypothetical protein